ncbi:Basic leucine zipper 6 [Spatholobus suberectus]|nr:Basic leucine zipper 6 [Spatholobus suberectus]
MRDLKIRGDLVEEQSWPKKPTLVKPIPRRAQARGSIGVGSSFQPWRKPYKPLHKLATIPENDNHITEENVANGGAAANDQNTSNEAEANIEQETVKQLKRIISNRHSARRSRLKKLAYMEDLENTAKSCKDKIALLHRQIEAQQNEQRLLQIEHHRLKFHMAACEKQRILREVEIEKNRAEVDRLKEVQRKLAAEAQPRRMLNLTSLQLMSNSNLNLSALAGLDRRN